MRRPAKRLITFRMTRPLLSTLTGSLFVSLLSSIVVSASAQNAAPNAASLPAPLPLYTSAAPVADSTTDTEMPQITVLRPEKPNGTAMVICPGGGYGGLVIGAEGTGIAQWLNQHGITGVVLKYRLPKGRSMVPLLDAQRAIRTTRAHAKEWGLDPQKIGIIGFSAGGHLASTAETHFDSGNAASSDPVERVSSRPDFAILIYPVISMGEKGHAGSRKNLLGAEPSADLIEKFSNETQVTPQTPPTFLAHAVNDKTVPVEHSQMFNSALQAAKVPAKLLELPEGGHGLNGYKGPMWDAWQTQSLEWLKEQKLTP